MIKKIITITSLLAILTGCSTTNYNDVMAQFVESQERVAKINADRDIKVAEYKAVEIQAMVTADAGGVSWTDPVTKQTLTYKNPNPYFYANGSQSQNRLQQTTQRSTALSLPTKQPSLTDKALGFIGGFVSQTLNVAITNAVPIFGAIEQNKTQRIVAEFDYKKSSDMFATYGNFGNNMEAVATTATGDMKQLGQSAMSEIKQVAVTNSQENTKQIGFYTENFKNNYTQVEKYESEILKELSEISTSSSVSSSSWTLEDDEPKNLPAVAP